MCEYIEARREEAMTRTAPILATTAAALAVGFAPTTAGASPAWQSNVWQSPTGNIHCEWYPTRSAVTCMTVNNHQQAIVGLNYTRGYLMARAWARDPHVTPWTPVLPYGYHWASPSGVNCWSRVDGMTCRTKYGHGFFMSRERQQVW